MNGTVESIGLKEKDMVIVVSSRKKAPAPQNPPPQLFGNPAGKFTQ